MGLFASYCTDQRNLLQEKVGQNSVLRSFARPQADSKLKKNAAIFLTKNFTGTSGIASAAILNPENENFQFPTLEPGFDLLSDDWFQVNVTETGKKNTTYRLNHK